jgi:putative ABC transport system permease protein
LDVDTYASEADRENDHLIWIFTLLLIAVTAGYGAIAVGNTLVMAAAGRMPDFRVLRLTGATRWQVARTASAEAAFVVTVGALLAGAVSIVALLSIRQGLSEQVQAPVDLVLPWAALAGVIAACTALAVAVSGLLALKASPRNQ